MSHLLGRITTEQAERLHALLENVDLENAVVDILLPAPIPGIACGQCDADIFRVATGPDGGEFVCARGHRAGVWFNHGALPLGVMVCEDGHPLDANGRDPRDPMNPWPRIRPATPTESQLDQDPPRFPGHEG